MPRVNRNQQRRTLFFVSGLMHPVMMTKLLVYAYRVGVFSSRNPPAVGRGRFPCWPPATCLTTVSTWGEPGKISHCTNPVPR